MTSWFWRHPSSVPHHFPRLSPVPETLRSVVNPLSARRKLRKEKQEGVAKPSFKVRTICRNLLNDVLGTVVEFGVDVQLESIIS